jgi:hypothetical protein
MTTLIVFGIGGLLCLGIYARWRDKFTLVIAIILFIAAVGFGLAE